MEKYFFNNCWWIHHPTINFFTFEVTIVNVFGNKCVLEKYQDGEIWSDDEYWGSVLYDFENNRYTYMATYLDDGKTIEEILNKWTEQNPDNVWNGKISKDFVDDKTKWAVDFYKSYIKSETTLTLEDYYKNVYSNECN